jgi:hypothetical protein
MYLYLILKHLFTHYTKTFFLNQNTDSHLKIISLNVKFKQNKKVIPLSRTLNISVKYLLQAIKYNVKH